MTIRALELFCGIGGFAAAAAGTELQVVGALDQNPDALDVYRLNYPEHWARRVDLERISSFELASYHADFWWLSPPCQPYTVRGCQRDLDDHRARSLVHLMELMAGMPAHHLPRHLALENVEGFTESEARRRLLALLQALNYEIRERLLCPTELGVPSRRPRYYLTASQAPLRTAPGTSGTTSRPLSAYLHDISPAQLSTTLQLPDDFQERFGAGIRILSADDPDAYTTCFTSGYGRSAMHAGSYLYCGDAARFFTPEELAGLLHFPASFRFPRNMPIRKQWHLIGNSLSVIAVREILTTFPELQA